MQPERSIATILFTDIVGSTERAAELGDRGWGDVLEQHHAIVREILGRWGGREVSETGDGFLSLFDNPAHAILCAVAIRDSVRDIGLKVRCGVHLGQVERKANGSVGGIAVHIGARVAAAAGAGEVLVTSTVRDAESGSGFGFEDRGRCELKGVPREWLLFAVTGVPEAALPPRRRAPWVERIGQRKIVGAIALAALVVVAGLYVVIQDRGESFSPAPAIAEAAPGIAVLPFTVRGQDLDIWREGMVDLLSTGLDGVAGLRAISSRTVLARWDEHVPGVATADLATALEVARATGARYALVGSLVSSGSEIRLSADVHEIETENTLGRAQVEGVPDSIMTLVDRLSVAVLSVILQRGEEELPEIDMASLTTDSPEALMAYLEGEVHLRHHDIEAAREAYTRAVEADSTFALAHSRLAEAYSWHPRNQTLADRHLARAIQFSDRLPAREALLVRAARALEWGLVDELEALHEAVRAYPDDAGIWFQLGETLLHVRGAMVPAEEVETAFERAVHLDPKNGLYLLHYTEFAWTVHADSQEAARRLEMYERAASKQSASSRAFRLALDLAFGDSAAQADAMARLESEEYNVLRRTSWKLLHPRYRQNLAVTRMRFQRADESHNVSGASWHRFLTLTYYGRFQELLEQVEDPRLEPWRRAASLYGASSLGFPVPVESLEEAIGSIAIDKTADPLAVGLVGLYAADQRRWSDHEGVIAELEQRANLALAEADSLGAWISTRRANALRGYGLWKKSGPEAALPILGDPNQLGDDWLGWWWLGQLYQELGRSPDAKRLYRTFQYAPNGSISIHPLAHRELGKVYEALEEYDKARESYEYFVEYWQNADPELQPMVEEARQAIIRLKGLRRE